MRTGNLRVHVRVRVRMRMRACAYCCVEVCNLDIEKIGRSSSFIVLHVPPNLLLKAYESSVARPGKRIHPTPKIPAPLHCRAQICPRHNS